MINPRTLSHGTKGLLESKISYRRIKTPLIFQPLIYIGEDTHIWNIGDTYYLLTEMRHWDKNIGYAYYVTTKDDPITHDYDYCCSIDLDTLLNDFWEG